MESEIPYDPNPDINEYLTKLEENPEGHVGAFAAYHMSRHAVDAEKRIYGQINIENGQPGGLNVMFCSYPSGDFYCWFTEVGYFIVIVLVDEKCKTLLAVDVREHHEFQRKLNSIGNQLNIKNHYPVEIPEDFQPHTSEDNPPEDNPPEKE